MKKDIVIKEIDGVIIKVTKNNIDVKFGKETIITFPEKLFDDKSFLLFGYPIKYQIKETSSGTRYQKFIPGKKPKKMSKKARELIKILDSI